MILADENINTRIIEEIRKIPVEVFSIVENYQGISDEEVIILSKSPPRIILTEDKDFGILLKYKFNELNVITEVLINKLSQNISQFSGSFTTITPKSIRIRKLNS